MWTVENRVRYDRSTLRCPSDLTDAEWSLISRLSRGPSGEATSGRSTCTRWSTD